MKILGIVVIMLAVLGMYGCSNTPSKLERIEANEAAISALQNVEVIDYSIEIDRLDGRIDNTNESINRAFEKSQYK